MVRGKTPKILDIASQALNAFWVVPFYCFLSEKLLHPDEGWKCLPRVCLLPQVHRTARSPQLAAQGLHHPHQGALGHSCHILSHSQSPPRRERVRWWSSTTGRWRTPLHFLKTHTRSSSFIVRFPGFLQH